MKLSHLYIVCCCSMLWMQCAQDPIGEFPEPFEGEPIFTVSATIGGRDLSLSAGLDNYYIFTSFEKDSQDVFVFKGDLKQESCPDICAEQLRIEIKDNHMSPNTETTVDSSLFNALVFSSLPMPEAEKYQVNFQIEDIGADINDVSYQWDFGDGSSSTAANPVHEYTVPDQYFVKLNTTDSDGCQSSQTQLIDIANPEQACSVFIEALFIENNQIQLEAMTTAEEMNVFYTWSADSSFTNPISIFQSGTYCVSWQDSLTCASSSCATVRVDSTSLNPSIYCTTSFAYGVETTSGPPINPALLSTFTLIYTDDTGQEFRSDIGVQSEAVLNITNVEEFDENENGEKTKKLDIELACRLYHENGTVLELTNGTLVFAIAYP